jgi:hypothetical protein
MGLLGKAVANYPRPAPNKGGKVRTRASVGGLLSRASRKIVLEKSIMDSLGSNSGTFQGIIIEALHSTAGGFSGRIFSMVSDFGTVQPLASRRCLVLFGPAQDRDLIARHLAKMVPGKSIFCFRAENPQEAFTLLKPYF